MVEIFLTPLSQPTTTKINIQTFASVTENLPFLQPPSHPPDRTLPEVAMFPPQLPPTTNNGLNSLSASSLLQVTHPPVQIVVGSSTVAKSESLPQLPFLVGS